MFLSEREIRDRLRLEDLIPALRRALIEFSAGRVIQPVRTIVPVPEHHGYLGLMPAVYGDLMGAKLVTFYPGNAGRLPTHHAVVQLFSAATGEPLVTMDGRLITELRTAPRPSRRSRLTCSPAPAPAHSPFLVPESRRDPTSKPCALSALSARSESGAAPLTTPPVSRSRPEPTRSRPRNPRPAKPT